MDRTEIRAYAAIHKDLAIRMDSRSGGFFTAASDEILRRGGVIYGCVLTENYEAVHIRAEDARGRDRMRGSKYVQSDMLDMFRSVKADLESGRQTLFSGTSCQVAGLKAFLSREYSNLYCVDIICHGVPSPLVWRNYLKWQEKKYGRCIAVDFRNKRDFGWADHVETLTMEGKNGIRKINSRIFTSMFYGHMILRPSCYKCPYKSMTHPGDITIADFWEIDRVLPGLNDNKGISLVLLNNSHGEELFDHLTGDMEIREVRTEDCFRPSMLAPFPAPENRRTFWRDFSSQSFWKVARKYGGDSIKIRLKKYLQLSIKRIRKTELLEKLNIIQRQ